MIKAKSWTKEIRYLVIDAYNKEIGKYKTKKGAERKVKQLEETFANAPKDPKKFKLFGYESYHFPWKIDKKELNIGHYDKMEIIKNLYNNGYEKGY